MGAAPRINLKHSCVIVHALFFWCFFMDFQSRVVKVVYYAEIFNWQHCGDSGMAEHGEGGGRWHTGNDLLVGGSKHRALQNMDFLFNQRSYSISAPCGPKHDWCSLLFKETFVSSDLPWLLTFLTEDLVNNIWELNSLKHMHATVFF